MKIFVFGASGMLGQYLTKYLSYYFEVIPITRYEIDLSKEISSITQKYTFNSSDVIINAAGVIKQRDYSSEELIRVNSLFPHFLARLGCNVIHITTDCVFSGNTGHYDEDSPHDCIDDYGKSKSLGECKELTVIRTSIIGEEVNNKKSLLEVIRSNKHSTINGFINHFWNGITCLELAKQIRSIIELKSYWKGVRHFHSPDTVSKFQLVSYINEIYELGNKVNPVMVDHCDRSLSTKYINPVKTTIEAQIIELRNFGIPHKVEELSIQEKLEGFPSVNFISIPESKERRVKLCDTLLRYGVKTVRPYIYERYKSGDHKIIYPDPKELPDYKYVFPDACMGAFTSHLKAIKTWYESTTEEYAFFCEDDISFETVKYWNFTWKQFFNNLPKDWECVQLSLVRVFPTMFVFFDKGVKLRDRCWCDWSACGYLITRDRARKLLNTYYNGDTFVWDYRGSDKQLRKEQHNQTWPYEPGIETILFSILEDKPVYTFPLLVFDAEADTTVWGEDENQKNMFSYSHIAIMDISKQT
jgi:dTDP-4-dehydrorhamnose reductase